MSVLSDFGINPILLAAQVVNFLILLFILKKFLYGPILKVLDQRKQKIEQSLKNAEEIEKRLQESTERQAELILKSGEEGAKILRDASDQAIQIIEEGRMEYKRLIDKAVEDIRKLHEAEKEAILSDAKEHLAALVTLTFEKVTGLNAGPEQKKVIEKEVKNFS